MTYILTLLAFYGIPIGVLAFFIVSLVRFCRGRKANKLAPNTFSPEEMRLRKTTLIVASVIMGVLAAVVIGLTVLLFMAVAFM